MITPLNNIINPVTANTRAELMKVTYMSDNRIRESIVETIMNNRITRRIYNAVTNHTKSLLPIRELHDVLTSE